MERKRIAGKAKRKQSRNLKEQKKHPIYQQHGQKVHKKAVLIHDAHAFMALTNKNP